MITFTIAILMLVTFILINFNIKTSSAVSHEVGNEFFKNHSKSLPLCHCLCLIEVTFYK